MMKSSVMRQARLCRVALQAATRVQIAPRTVLTAPSASASISIAHPTSCRPLGSILSRFYSSEAAAPESGDGSHKHITQFADLATLGVDRALVESITHGMGYDNMTEVQSATINAALDGRDLVAQARTGTGKTLAFLVPVIQRILAQQPELARRSRGSRARCDDIRAVIISPTRELAEQITVEARKLVRNTGLVVQAAVGGTQKSRMLRETQAFGCHLLVGTPGRLHDLLSDPDSGIAAPKLEALVLDEADRMLDSGFQVELQEILKYLPDRRDVPRQTLLFSATIPKDVVGLARTYINPENFEFVQTIKPDELQTHDKVPQFIAPCKSMANMYPALLELIERETAKAEANPDADPFKAIVFLPTTASVVFAHGVFDRIARRSRTIPRVMDIHSKLSQQQRTRHAEDFRRAKSAVLMSSDVTARGLDFPNVTHVIQLHVANERDSYIHRLGRTGRAGKSGEGWLIVSDGEVSVARKRLTGLPIQRSTDLVCTTADPVSGQDLPEQFEKIRDAVSAMPSHLVDDCYSSLLGNALKGVSNQVAVEGLNEMALHTWGLQELPAVSHSKARSMGMPKGLRVGSSSHPGHGRGVGARGSFGGGDRFDQAFGGRSDGGYSRDRGDRGFSRREGGYGQRDGGFGRRDGGFGRRDGGRGEGRGGYGRRDAPSASF